MSEDSDADEEVEEDELDTAGIVCGDLGGDWNSSTKKCKCKNANGKSITTKNPVSDCVKQEARESVTEEEVEEDELDTAGIVCGDLGGDWNSSTKKCKCKNANGKSITTKNPVSDCVKQDAAKTNELESDDSNADDNTKAFQEACSSLGGKMTSTGKCECKNKAGRTTRTGNPERDCVKPAVAATESTAKTKGVAERGATKSDV